MEELYHIHRKENHDALWQIGKSLTIDDNFTTKFYKDILEEEKALIKKFGNYDIDYIIAMMEEMLNKGLIDEKLLEDFNIKLKRYYFLRREYALEEGRKLFNPTAPSRLHSIFLTSILDLQYWLPKNLTRRKEYIFQGKAKIIK